MRRTLFGSSWLAMILWLLARFTPVGSVVFQRNIFMLPVGGLSRLCPLSYLTYTLSRAGYSMVSSEAKYSMSIL